MLDSLATLGRNTVMSAGFSFRASTAGAERLALRLRMAGSGLPVSSMNSQSIEAGTLRLAIVEDAHLLAQQVIPVLAVELEIVGGVLALVDLGQVVFGQAQVFEWSACGRRG